MDALKALCEIQAGKGFAVRNKPLMRSSLRLTRWLRCRFNIKLSNVIGHNESLSSPYHHEDVAALRKQTHQDMQHKSMNSYRKRLARGGCA